MPEQLLTFVEVAPDQPFSSMIHPRFSKRGTTAPHGMGPDNVVLYQFNTWDPLTDDTITVTQEDFVENNVRVRRLVFLYWG